VGTLIRRLHEQAKAGWGSAVVDLVEWFSWTTFDIVGELGFGETFGCLTDTRHHSWSALVFSHFKAASLVTSVRFYPFLERFLRVVAAVSSDESPRTFPAKQGENLPSIQRAKDLARFHVVCPQSEE
jgi:hypothetical protein